MVTDKSSISRIPSSFWRLLLVAFLVACGEEDSRRFPPTFFVERVPSDSPDAIQRAGLRALHQEGTPSASVTLNDDTRRALTPSLPSRLTFAVEVPPEAALDFSFAVATERTPERWPSVHFRIALNDGSGEKTVFQETARLSQRNRWLDRTVELADWRQQEAQILFEIRTDDSDGSFDPVYPMWGNPTLYSRDYRRERSPIVLISVDCLRPDHMRLYGYWRDTTPNLDAFAQDSIVFETASAASSWTLPSHMSMLTGLTPSFHAVSRERKLATSIPYLPQILSKAGYEIDGIVSGAYLSPSFGFERGFHNYRVLTDRAQQVVDAALGLLQRTEGRDFFLFVHLFDPHWRYLPPEDFVERFGPRPPQLEALLNKVIERQPPSGPEDIEHLKTLYDGEIAYVDRELGRLLDWLRVQGLYQDSLIIVTSDHGEAFYEHGYWQHSETLYEEMTRVPLIVKLPGNSGHRGVETPVSHVDIFATILQAAGLPPPPSQGRSLTGRTGASDDSKTISEVIWWADEDTRKIVSLRSQHLKYIASFEATAQDDLTIHKMLREELYDLSADAEERNNLETSRYMTAFRGELDALLDQARKFRADQEKGGPVVIDDEVRERLRALGYMQ